MSTQKTPGALYIVATPIGNLQDITLRALETLKSIDLIAAEDTRNSKNLLYHYGIDKPLLSLHDFNEDKQSNILLEKIRKGQNVALISDAGTPLISDPGYRLTKLAHEKNIQIIPIPGACAAISALSASGLPTDRFVFEGFLAAKNSARRSRLKELQDEERSLVFYESPHRILETLQDCIAVFGGTRDAVYARELTKLFETLRKSTLEELFQWIKNDANQQKGEIVLIISGIEKEKIKPESFESLTSEQKTTLRALSEALPSSQAAELASKILSPKISKNLCYKMILALKNRL
ncbi:MAG: 16S rRNA (cytidine(1402)-2'-O)-methyltransferase [Gammaproteobacteria bacterium]